MSQLSLTSFFFEKMFLQAHHTHLRNYSLLAFRLQFSFFFFCQDVSFKMKGSSM